jgi:hypothetical protein
VIRFVTRAMSRVFVIALLASGVGAAVATPALADIDCSVSHSANGEGSGYTAVSKPLKVGPYGDCATTGANTGTYGKVWLHCYVYNDYSNLWWWVRIDGTQKYGWIYASHLTGVDFDDNNDGREDITWC